MACLHPRCSDGAYYVGQTDDLKKLLKMHLAGQGSRHTASRLPVELIYSEQFLSRSEAMAREFQLKQWSRAKKEALIRGDRDDLKNLSKSRE